MTTPTAALVEEAEALNDLIQPGPFTKCGEDGDSRTMYFFCSPAPSSKSRRPFRARPRTAVVATELLHSGRILPEEVAALGEP